MKNKVIGIMALAMLAESMNNPNRHPEDETPRPRRIIRVIPKGCNQYWFRADGTFTHSGLEERLTKFECVFDCIASSDKVAIKKFNKYIK